MSDTRLVLSPSPWVRDIQTDDGAALLDIQQGICFSMNPVGARIWNMLKLHSSIDQMSDTIAAEFKVDEQQARDDVLEFIRALTDKALAICGGRNDNSDRRNWFLALLSKLSKGRADQPHLRP
jgi:hypothetical protein